MKIKKTVGSTPAIGRKSYTIHTECGQEFKATPAGSQAYECNSHRFSSLKAVKAYVLEANDEVADIVEMNEQGELWDCIHPCALLIKELPAMELLGGTEVHQTLSNYGWLNEDGSPDTDKADRAFKTFENNKESLQDTEPSGE